MTHDRIERRVYDLVNHVVYVLAPHHDKGKHD